MRSLFALVVALVALAAGCGSYTAPEQPKKLGYTYDTCNLQWLAENSSAAASTTLVGSTRAGFQNCSMWTFDAKIVGATGGTLDVYLQKKVATNVWVDFAHFTQVAGGTTSRFNIATDEFDATPIAVGFGTDSTPSVVLAANAVAHGHMGDQLRLVTVTGTGVTVAGNVTIYAYGRTSR